MATNPIFTQYNQDINGRQHLRNIWRNLTEPVAAIQDLETRRRARFLSSMLLPIIVLGLAASILSWPAMGAANWAVLVISWGSLCVLSGAYALSRTRHYVPAALLAVLNSPAAVFAIMVADDQNTTTVDASLLVYLLVGVLMSSVLLNVTWTVFISILDTVGILLLPLFLPTLTFMTIISHFTYIIILATLIVIVAYLRSQDLKRIEQQVADLEQASTTQQEMTLAEQQRREYLETTVQQYIEYAQAVGQGDLTGQLDLEAVRDTVDDPLVVLGHHLGNMTTNLQNMITQLRRVSTDVATATAEILTATTQQNASATEQDTAITQTMATVDEVVATVQQTAERAQQVADAAQQSMSVSREGQAAVENSIIGMHRIQAQVENIAETILALSAHTQQIGEIIDTVNDIADQSKLLALNASIEAARAGEEGKGFAVVALEVRQLAEQSRDATERVRNILNEIQQATNTAVMVTEEGSKGADSGMTLVERAGETIRELATTIDNSSQAARQIAASTQQQTTGMEQLAAAMTSIRQASIQAATSNNQAERSAKNLNDMAKQMEQAVAQYQV